uniref:NADH dehydrogenase subunit 3 n=1 Tax=Neoseiulus chebalingensis TaxID=3061192 RepID=UPI0030FF2F42
MYKLNNMMLMLLISFMLSTLLYMLCLLSMKNLKNKEKMFSFECGFNPFFAPRNPFSIQFFKILMIFLLFDMEIIIILPLPLFFYFSMNNLIYFMIMMTMLIIGLFIEWSEGALNWLH